MEHIRQDQETGQSHSLGLLFVGVGVCHYSYPTHITQPVLGMSLHFPGVSPTQKPPPICHNPSLAVECTCTGSDRLGNVSRMYPNSSKYPVKTDTEKEQQILLLFIFKKAFQSSGKKDNPLSQIFYIIFHLRISTGQIHSHTVYNNYKEQCYCRCSYTNANTFYFTHFN